MGVDQLPSSTVNIMSRLFKYRLGWHRQMKLREIKLSKKIMYHIEYTECSKNY